jgi:cell division protein ZapB
MESQLSLLEVKIRQTLDLCQRLREENRQLRQQLADSESARRGLAEKINGASERLEGLLHRIPE